jgi:FKBP-type peptidyl-prolyl cis-trans isomerase FklB
MKKIFFFITCLLIGFISCSKDEDTTEDARLVNKANKEAGERFLLDNRSNENVTERASGLQFSVISDSGSDEKPFLTDSVRITYSGQLIDGTLFADTTETFLLSQLIPGMQEGISIMRKGAEYKLFIPYYLAYNNQPKSVVFDGKSITIKPYSVLIYDVTLNSIIRN